MEQKIVIWKDGTSKSVDDGITHEFENDKNWLTTIDLSTFQKTEGHTNFPSLFNIKQVVDFVINGTRHTSTLRNVHFSESKVKYDLDVWMKSDGGNSSTRIYNVDSCFVELPRTYSERKEPLEFSEIDITTPEGQYLLAAVAYFGGINKPNKTPQETMKYLDTLRQKMSFDNELA